MGAVAIGDAVLLRLRAELQAAYGARLERVVLFGSRARGDHDPESDYDVAVFIRDCGRVWDELGVLAPIMTELLLDTGDMISAKPFRAGGYQEGSPLMREIARDGIDL